jgi:hypothetical protein
VRNQGSKTMKTSEIIDLLSADYALAQLELKNATFDKINPHFKSKYATLAQVRDTTAPVLAKHGLAIIQVTDMIDGALFLVTRLVHKSGQWIEGLYPIAIGKPQEMGSALTYGRRYSLAGVCGIASEEDDDGNEGSKGEAPKVMPSANGTYGASKAATRGDYNAFITAIRNSTGVAALEKWKNENLGAIDKLSPEWVDELRIEYVDRKSELEKAGHM